MRAATALRAAVATTFGPRGAAVHVGADHPGRPPFTRDGARVARAIAFADLDEHTVADQIVAAAEDVERTTGDGATATIILASTLVTDAVKVIDAGAAIPMVCASLERAVVHAVQHLARTARPVHRRADVAYVAGEAAHGDALLGALVGRALEHVGPYGHVRVAPRRAADVDLELDELGAAPPTSPPIATGTPVRPWYGRGRPAALPLVGRFEPSIIIAAERLGDEIERRDSSERAALYERMGTLTRRCATLRVASTDPDHVELEAHARRAIGAARSAMRRGVVTGGGIALLRATASGQSLGARMLADAATEVVARLAASTGDPGGATAARIRGMAGPMGLNARTGRIEDLDARGICDPVEVVESSLAWAVRIVRGVFAPRELAGGAAHAIN